METTDEQIAEFMWLVPEARERMRYVDVEATSRDEDWAEPIAEVVTLLREHGWTVAPPS